jgi:hypothetical protein
VTTGSYYDTGGTQQGFVRTRNGTFTKFDPSNGNFGQQQIYPTAINPAGAVTGYYETADYTFHGFLRAPDGTFTQIDPTPPVLYSTYTTAVAINPAGAITGSYTQMSVSLFLGNLWTLRRRGSNCYSRLASSIYRWGIARKRRRVLLSCYS